MVAFLKPQNKEYTVARYRMLTTESMRSAMWFSFWSLVALTGVHLYIFLCLQGPLHVMNYFGMFAVLLMWPDQYKWLRGNVTTRTFHSLFGMSILYLCVIGKDCRLSYADCSRVSKREFSWPTGSPISNES